ncbi:autotransporter domain-containing protein [Amphritea sp.]|uniref:autotransporter domain-containing protein n=1 Tax=Amphritea sp. TaxID=1872502 RepID=UPI003D0C6F1A
MIINSGSSRFQPKLLPLLISSVLCFTGQSTLAEASLTEITQAPNDISMLRVSLNASGGVVVGTNIGELSQPAAFQWKLNTGITGIQELENHWLSIAFGISSDGNSIIASSYKTADDKAPHAFLWSKDYGLKDLGTLGGNYSVPFDVNSDGSKVVGRSELGPDDLYSDHAFLWSESSGMVDLGSLGEDQSNISQALGISADGYTVVGDSFIGSMGNTYHAFRWTQAAGMVDLGTEDFINSSAHSVSADGGVIVGKALTRKNIEYVAFRWTEKSGMVSLGALPNHKSSSALKISDNGQVIVGVSGPQRLSYDTTRAFRWETTNGMQSIEEWLTDNNVDISDLSAPTWMATDTSADGSVVVGLLHNRKIFIARVKEETGSGLITREGLSESLLSSSSATNSTMRKIATLVNGAHSHPMSRRVNAGQDTIWSAGDLGSDDHNNRNGSFGIAEIGAGHNFGPIQVNASLGKTWSDQNLVSGGDVDSEGSYIMLEGILPVLARQKLFATVGTFGHWGEADIRRGYLNAGTPDFSSASPDTISWGVRARIDWLDAWSAGQVNFTPYSDISYTKTELDGYTEVGGGFPTQFNKRIADITELRLGVNASIAIQNRNVQLFGGLEATHRLDKQGIRTSGQLLGLYDFELDSPEYDSTWYKATFGLEGRLSKGKASLMLNGTTEGEMPDAWLAASYEVCF